MPEIIIAGNWKMNKTAPEAVELATKIKDGLKKEGQSLKKFGTVHKGTVPIFSVVICPPFTALGDVAKVLKGSEIKLGAQDMFWEEAGAYTGVISAGMLISSGCQFVILGHSERRIYFVETDLNVNRKIKRAISSGLRPIVCCGEKLEEREKGEAEVIVERQIRGALRAINEKDVVKCVIAYEPVWAIGTGKTATPGEAQEMHRFIRGILSKLYSQDISSSLSILYGGSVKPENTKELMEAKDINGALVGGASLNADSFLKIIKYGGNS